MSVRRIPSRREAAISWNFFCDVIWSIPPRIHQLLRQKCLFGPLNYRDRVYIAAFAFQNGVSPEVVYEMLFLNTCCTVRKAKKVVDLYPYWSRPGDVGEAARSRYWAYDIVIGRICDLNKQVFLSPRSR